MPEHSEPLSFLASLELPLPDELRVGHATQQHATQHGVAQQQHGVAQQQQGVGRGVAPPSAGGQRAVEGDTGGGLRGTGGGRPRRPTPSGGAAQRAMEGYLGCHGGQRAMEGYVLSGGETHL